MMSIISAISRAIVKISPNLQSAWNLADKTAKNKLAQSLLFQIKYQANFGKL